MTTPGETNNIIRLTDDLYATVRRYRDDKGLHDIIRIESMTARLKEAGYSVALDMKEFTLTIRRLRA
jgi:hypothetical protein